MGFRSSPFFRRVYRKSQNYRRSGFTLACSNIRFERSGTLSAAAADGIVPLAEVPFAQLADYDRRFFPAQRDAFLRYWIAQPGSTALAFAAGGRLQGYGVIRKCLAGCKIGPLFADGRQIAERLYVALCRHAAEGEPVYLDVPEVNAEAVALAGKFGMKKVFGTARMYTGEFPHVAMDGTFGVTTFELG